MADISIEVNEINVVSVENMADISIEVNEINVVSVETVFNCLSSESDKYPFALLSTLTTLIPMFICTNAIYV